MWNKNNFIFEDDCFIKILKFLGPIWAKPGTVYYQLGRNSYQIRMDSYLLQIYTN